jgi:hypothetical protein
MNAIQKAIDEIKYTIPRPILETVFIKKELMMRNTPISIDSQMLLEVIRPRVLIDCNLIGGTEAIVSLQGIQPEITNQYTSVYRIPKQRTQGRSIISALNVTFADPRISAYDGGSFGIGNSTVLQTAQGVFDASAAMPNISSSDIQIIGENVVMIRGTSLLPTNIYLRCMIANDDNLSHLQLRSYKPFATACILAVKSYIYLEYAIKMDQGELYGGQNLGKFKDIVDGYSDAEELYQTHLREKMQKILYMNDRESYSRHIKTMVSGNR